MQNYTQDKLVLIHLIDKFRGVGLVQTLITHFAFTDILLTTKQSILHNHLILQDIRNSSTRFSMQTDDSNEVWHFNNRDIQLQGYNCIFCGGFRFSQWSSKPSCCTCYGPPMSLYIIQLLENDNTNQNTTPEWV